MGGRVRGRDDGYWCGVRKSRKLTSHTYVVDDDFSFRARDAFSCRCI